VPKNIYGYTNKGKDKIVAPDGWVILSEGEEVPEAHREHLELYNGLKSDWYSLWADPRRCHSTMTPLTAQIWGAVRAIAIKIES